MTARSPILVREPRIHSRSRLRFDAAAGKTRLAAADLGAPLRAMRGFLLPDGRLLVQIISAAPGLFSGDRYELTIEVAEGARAVVLTPAATKIHSMPDGGRAVQTIQAAVAAGASLEICPTLSIPFADAEFEQQADVSLAETSRFGWLDPWSLGRIARGEISAFRRISTRLRIDREAAPLYRDALEMEPAVDGEGSWGVSEDATHLVAGCWFGPAEAWTPSGALDDEMVYGTVGADGLYVRGAFRDSLGMQRALEDLHLRVGAAWGTTPFSRRQFTL